MRSSRSLSARFGYPGRAAGKRAPFRSGGSGYRCLVTPRGLRILTWHVHGSYLEYLGHVPHTFYVPVRPGRPAGYAGLPPGREWPGGLVEVPWRDVRALDLDAVLFQSFRNYDHDQDELLSAEQRSLPRLYLEHDPPRESPTDTRHPAADTDVLVVHVTPFNELMWDCGTSSTRVVDHGVTVPADARYTGELERGLVIVNNLARRGRRLGLDVFERVRREVPLDLVGMNSEEVGGLGEVPPPELPAFAARYRFLFNPIRYTSLGLAVCEAMAVGLPVVGLATTEMATALRNDVSGYVDTDVSRLVERMRALLSDRELARRLGEGARREALRRFSLARFAADWDETLRAHVGASGRALERVA